VSGLILKLRRFEGWFGAFAFAFIVAGLYFGLVQSPPDHYQGEVARIMYIHVPFAKNALLAYLTLFLGSLWYLWKRDLVVDNLCHAAAGIGLFFTLIALITGSIWAKPTWNTWWTWDPKLTSFAVLLMIQAGYLMLRTFIDDPDREARYAAVLAIVGFIDLPIVYLAAEWWRTLHQPLSVSIRGLSISGEMLIPLVLMSIGLSLLLAYMLMVRTQMLYLEQLLKAKQGRLLGRLEME
jgi:heme exporter protein C